MHALLLAVALAAPAIAHPTALAHLGALSAGDLTGVVRDSASGQGLAGGDVIVSRDGRIVVRSQTDAAGRFRIHNLPDGDYDVEVRLLGFRPATSRVTIGGTEHDTDLSVMLVPSIAHLQALETTAPVPVAVDTRTGNQVSCFQKFESVQGDARVSGVEFSAEHHPTSYLHLSGTADYTRGQNRSTDQPLPLVPPFRATYSARFEGHGSDVFQSPYILVGGESNARQTRLDPNDFAPAGYTLANVGAGVALATGPRTVHVDVALRNAFSKEYQSFLSRYKFAADPVVLDPGRNLTVRVSTDF